MKKFLLLFVTTLSCFSQAIAEDYFSDICPCDCCGMDLVMSVDVGGGYRKDNLKWAFPGFSPGVSIHETWKNINIGFVETNSRIVACQTYVFKLDFDYGWSGWQKQKHRATLVDYNSANEIEYSRVRAKANVYDFSAGLGYKFDLDCYCLTVAPFVGWSYQHQKFENRDYYDDEIHSSKYSWSTPWIGFETTYQICCPWMVYFDYSYHSGRFHAKVNEFFSSRKKSTSCFGNEFELGSVYQLCEWWLGFKLGYKDFRSSKKDSVDDAEDGSGHKRRAQWNSFSIGADILYTF